MIAYALSYERAYVGTCIGCGEGIEGRRGDAKWCSNACRERTKRRARGSTGRIGRPRKERLYEPDLATGCWEWLLGRHPQGYGLLSRGGKTRRATRVMWEVVNGPVPLGLELHHRCENTGCVNPDHLELLTRPEHAHRHSGRDRRGKLTARVVLAMRAGEMTAREAMVECDVGYQAAWEAKVGRSWRAL